MLEDRAGTPHISELRHDEEMLMSPDVEELGMAGAVEAIGGSAGSMTTCHVDV